MKRKLIVCLALVLGMTMLFGIVAQASKGTFSFRFYSVNGSQDSDVGYRDKAKGTDYSAIVTNGNISSSNVLGMRPRKGPPYADDSLGNYKTYKTLGKSYARQYSRNVATGKPVILRAKKDDSSTTSASLTANGNFTP